jgi:hypothetical protein
VGAAPQIVGSKASAPQDPSGQPHVTGLAAVRGAHQRDFRVAELELLLAARKQQRHRLERLRRGPRVDRKVGVAAALEEPSLFVYNREAAPMHRLDVGSSVNPREHRRGLRHGSHYGNFGYLKTVGTTE